MPASIDISLTIGGDAGQGVESSGASFSRALARAGYHVFSIADYRSRIRGGHNFYQIRMADRPLSSHSDDIHMLVAFTREAVELHLDNLQPGAAVIYDDGFRIDDKQVEAADRLAFPAPLTKIAEEHGSKVMFNTAALGVAAGVLGLDLRFLADGIRASFEHKGSEIVQGNLDVLDAAYRYAEEHFAGRFAHPIPPQLEGQPQRMLLNGNQAFCLAAATAGCSFIAAYPMTPATTILEWMTAHADDLGIVTKHAEDEIAAVCMAIGAGFTGARAMTATSGGGFSLMTEALGMAGIVEVPLVVVEAQRGGPSTGLPTRTEQSDLLFVIHASHGEFPRIVIAPGSIEACFRAGWQAFNLADRYQTPVIILTDQFLASSMQTVEPDRLPYGDIQVDRGALVRPDEPLEDTPYLRFRLTESGVSPRVVPGHPEAPYGVTTDEHDEQGHITEGIENRRAMMAKRMGKLKQAAIEMQGPTLSGPEDAELTLICWGSSCGPVREAVRLLKGRGLTVNILHFEDLWPFPVEATQSALQRTRRTVSVEQNYTAQFARLLRMCTGHHVDGTVLKYDGRPLSPMEIAEGVLKEVAAHA